MTVQEFISSLFEVRINAHIAHLQTSSYAKHKALDELYNDVVGFTDSYVEAYQGIYGIVQGYPQIKVSEMSDMALYLKFKVVLYRKYRDTIKESELQQKIDDIIEFFNTIIYKLKYLS
jgi:hypothetical protein